jgi:hypothetical protein
MPTVLPKNNQGQLHFNINFLKSLRERQKIPAGENG